MIEEVKADQVKCKIYLLSVLGDSERVKAINGQIKEIAEQNSVEYIDVMFELVDREEHHQRLL